MKKNTIKSSGLTIVLLSTFLNITGCSSVPLEQGHVQENNSADTKKIDKLSAETISAPTTKNKDLTIEKYEKLLTEWQEIKPDLKRLIAIESELSQLIDYLNNLAQTSESKQKVSNEKVNNTKTASPIKEKKPGTSSSSAGFSLQLAAVTKKSQINTAWAGLKKRHPKLLGALETTYEESAVKNKTYYRIKAGNFTSKAGAKALCQQLSALATPCIISKYNGIKF